MTDSAIISVPAVANANAYRWRLSTDATVDDSDRIITTIEPEVTFDNLLRNEVYWVNVRAENRSQQSMYSETLKFHVKLPETSDAPRLVNKELYSLEVEADPVDTATKYIWVLSDDASIDGSDTTKETTTPTITFEDLQHSKDYWIAVQAVAPGNSNTHLSEALATATVTLVFQKPTITRTAQTPFSLNYQTASQQEGLFYTWRIGQNANITDANSVQTTNAVQAGNFQTIKFDGLTYSTDYYVDVRVENDPAFSDYADTVKVTTIPFATPANPTNTINNPFDITMSIPRNIYATHYTWRIGQSLPLTDDNTTQSTVAATRGTNQTREFTGLAAKSDYYVDVRAENHTYSQNSPYATAVAVTTDEQQLNTPTIPALVSSTARTMELSTTVDNNYEGSAVMPMLSYEWEYVLTNLAHETDVITRTATSTTNNVTFRDLLRNAEYTVRVKAQSAVKGYIESEFSDARTITLPLSVPSTVGARPVISELTATSVVVTLNPVRGATFYVFQISPGSRGSTGSPGSIIMQSTTPTVTITGLDENTNYYAVYAAGNSEGTSPYDVDLGAEFTTPYSAKPLQPNAPTVQRQTSSSLNLRVTKVTRAANYRWILYTDPDDINGTSTTKVTSGRGVTFSGLTPGERYYAIVRAENPIGNSEYSSVGSFFTDFVAPPAPTLVSNMPHGITVSVPSVARAQQYEWTISYLLTHPGGGTSTIVRTATTNVNENDFGQLESGREYNISVKYVDGFTESDASPQLTVTTASITMVPQSKPVPSVASTATTSLTLQIESPLLDADTYDYRLSDDSTVNDSDSTASSSASSTQATFTGLTENTEYWFDARGVNNIGNGPYSDVVGPVKTTGTYTGSIITTASSGEGLEFRAPTRADATSYAWSLNLSTGIVIEKTTSDVDVTFNPPIGGFGTGTTYTISVYAILSDGITETLSKRGDFRD